jgi:hypothetical protein
MIGSNSDRSAFKARSLEPCKVISVYAHHDDLWSFAQLAISVPDQRKGLISDRTHSQQTNTYKLVRGFWLTSLTTILFTRIAPCTKSKGSPDRRSTHLLLLSACAFAAYKKQGAPDRRSTHLILLSACALPRIKSKGLHRYVLQIYYFINQVFKVFAAQQVSSSMVWLYSKPRERVS